MISKLYTEDWYGRTEKDYIYNPLDKMKGIVQIPNHKYSSFLYNEDKAERICSDINLLKQEMLDMTHAIGLSNIMIEFSEDVTTACTNGEYIKIGIGDDYEDISDCYEKIDRIIGMTIHESCHCLYTDFKYINKVINQYPSLVHHIHNVIEDELIEGKLCLSYPGYQNFLNKLKYNIFEKNSEHIEDPINKDINDILEILFYLIRYPKFISKIDEDILAKHERLFIKIKKIMNDYKCFDYKNLKITESSTNAAIKIYELIKDDIENNQNNQQEKESEEQQNAESNSIKINILNENDPIFDQIGSGEGGGIIAIMNRNLKDISSESEITNIKELTTYHTEIEKSITEFNDFTWDSCPDISINNNDIEVYKNENVSNYNKYKNEVSYYIKEAKRLIIANKAQTIFVDSKFNRNGSLDPTRLANAMCNEQTVYIRKEMKTINKKPEYALCIMLDESGSMEDHGINLLASKLAIMLYEAMQNYPKIKLFVYGHGDKVYKYIDIKNCKNKYVLGDRRQQYIQDELKSYDLIINDIKSQTKLPIVIFNITDSCYFSNPNNLAKYVNELKEDKQKTFINLICLGHNNTTNKSVSNWNDLIYGKGNWLLYNYNNINHTLIDTLKKISNIIHKTIKI